MGPKHFFKFSILLFICNCIVILPLIHISLLFISDGAYIFILGNSLLITILSKILSKIQLPQAAIIGALISCLSLNLAYLSWHLGIFVNPFYGFLLFLVASSVLWFLLLKSKLVYHKTPFSLIAVLGLFLIPYFVGDRLPSLPEKRNTVMTEIIIRNFAKKDTINNQVEISYLRQPLFGLQQTQTIQKLRPNAKGSFRINLASVFDIKIQLTDDKNRVQTFHISSNQLKVQRKFIFDAKQ